MKWAGLEVAIARSERDGAINQEITRMIARKYLLT
jgi:uncharacterized protein YggU (UPF0235/DUF167 family)